MIDLWLLEDLEPFPDRPVVGDDFAPTTFWVDAGSDYGPNRRARSDCSHAGASCNDVDSSRPSTPPFSHPSTRALFVSSTGQRPR